MGISATIVITTKNRKEELRVALRSAFAQSTYPEVVVMDDGSTDGTMEMIRAEFPQAVLHRFEESRGLIVRRNEGARLATGDVIFSMDDDAEFSTPLVVEQTLPEFNDLRVGAVAIPFIEPHKGNLVQQRAPSRDQVWVSDSFIGTAHALRRDVFLKLGGYREHFVHQGEESDFTIRMLDAGYFVRLGNADVILHHESPKRDFWRMDFYGPRNALFFAWQNVPRYALPLHFIATTVNCLRLSLKPARFWTRFRGVSAAYIGCVHTPRQPVQPETYRLWRQLRKQRCLPLADVILQLKTLPLGSAK